MKASVNLSVAGKSFNYLHTQISALLATWVCDMQKGQHTVTTIEKTGTQTIECKVANATVTAAAAAHRKVVRNRSHAI